MTYKELENIVRENTPCYMKDYVKESQGHEDGVQQIVKAIFDSKSFRSLYRRVELPSKESVQYVGCYVLSWGEAKEPTVGFVEVD